MRFVALDVETTGLNRRRKDNNDITEGHRVIEIGCVEIIDDRLTGRIFQAYINPGHPIDAKATEIHGLTNEDLVGKPVFGKIAKRLLTFIDGAILIIHNAPFDTAFLDKEFLLLDKEARPSRNFIVVDTLELARMTYPRMRNDLTSLSERLGIDSEKRQKKHGALLDATVLAELFLRLK